VTGAINRSITLSATPVVLDISTAGEVANYTFSFSSELPILETDEIWIQFPLQFDPYVAKSLIRYRWNQSSVYYVDCDNEGLGDDVEC